MNYIKQNPVGIDKEIQKLQTKLYERLGLENIEGYGRVYTLSKQDGVSPILPISKTDYKELLLDDRSNGKFFFVENTTTTAEMTISTTEVSIIFLMNLVELFPDVTHRADEELKKRIYKILKKTRFFFPSEIEIVKGKEALKDFKTSLLDMQPYHFIKFSGKVKYQLDN